MITCMSAIIPYYEDLGVTGAFISPDGEILRLKNNEHEYMDHIFNYCRYFGGDGVNLL